MKTRGFAGTFSLIIFFGIVVQNHAQVTIRETIEISSNYQQSERTSSFVKLKISDPGELYYPVLRDIGFGKFRVLKSGTLRLYIENAELYNRDLSKDTSFAFTVQGFDTLFSGTKNIEDALGTPIRFQNGNLSCNEVKEYFQPTKTVAIPAIEDTWVSRTNPTSNFGNDLQLVASGYNVGLSPDSANASIFVRFGLPNIATNGSISTSTIVLQADTDNTDITRSLRAFPVSGEWSEQTLTYNNRPAADTSFVPAIIITKDDLLLTQSGDTLSIYNKDISELAEALTATGFGLELASFGTHFLGSREFATQVTPPTLNQVIVNEADNSETYPYIDIGFVEAGDTLDLSFANYFKQLIPNFEAINDTLEAEELLTFSFGNTCKNSLIFTVPDLTDVAQDRYFGFSIDNDRTIPFDTLQPIFQTQIEPSILYDNGATSAPDMFLNYTMELYDVPTVNGAPIAYFGGGSDDDPGGDPFDDGPPPPGGGPGPGPGPPSGPSFEQRVFLDAFSRSAGLNVLADSLTQDSTFKVRVYGYMVK